MEMEHLREQDKQGVGVLGREKWRVLYDGQHPWEAFLKGVSHHEERIRMLLSKVALSDQSVFLYCCQVYNKEEKGYHCKNKYYGQQLSEEGFKETLLHFLHNGHGLRLDIADMIISRLEELSSIISKLDSVRFFTSSLLILYDGFDPSGSNFSQPDCKTERKREPSDHSRLSQWPDQPGEGSSLLQDKWSPKDSCIPPIKMTHPAYIHERPSPGGGKASREQVSRCESDVPSKSKGWQRNRNHRPPIDIRLIDFAHATHKGMGDSKLYSGPDEGILLGLNSLIKIFTDIRDRYKH